VIKKCYNIDEYIIHRKEVLQQEQSDAIRKRRMNTTNNDGYMSTNKNFNDDCFGLGFPFQLTDSGNDLHEQCSNIDMYYEMDYNLCDSSNWVEKIGNQFSTLYKRDFMTCNAKTQKNKGRRTNEKLS
jgi:hypothetical protein